MPTPAIYLNLDGIPSPSPRGDGQPYFSFDPQGVWRTSHDSGLHKIEHHCILLHEAFNQAIMKGVNYAQLIYMVPAFMSLAGHNSETTLTREQFERCLQKTAALPEINRFLYLYDCQNLVTSIQECTKEIEQVLGEFYFTLNMESFFFPPMKHEDGIRYTSSPVTTKLFAYLGFIFIRMHSLLDYTVKVAFEAENLQQDFSRYPKLKSGRLQYGNRRQVSFDKEAATLFEPCEFMTTVETLRNHIIHDGLLDDMPKAYEHTKDGEVVEKFVLFPDMINGHFERFLNRNLFYGSDDKINLRLPTFVAEFQARQVATLDRVLKQLQMLA